MNQITNLKEPFWLASQQSVSQDTQYQVAYCLGNVLDLISIGVKRPIVFILKYKGVLSAV